MSSRLKAPVLPPVHEEEFPFVDCLWASLFRLRHFTRPWQIDKILQRLLSLRCAASIVSPGATIFFLSSDMSSMCKKNKDVVKIVV
ncbi:hypothetical protein ARMGADRAFT_1015554, partial [Armillaria gallica]